MAKSPTVLDQDQPLTLINLPPGKAQIQFALVIVIASLGALFFTVGMLSNIQFGRIEAFFPAYGMALFINDLITAVLLYNQFAILRTRALLAISGGYLFAALM